MCQGLSKFIKLPVLCCTMKRKMRLFVYIWMGIGVVSTAIVKAQSSPSEQIDPIKTALREVGHQLLLQSKDSTSRVLPVRVIDSSTYRLSFEHDLTFEPSELVSMIETSLNKLGPTRHYRVAVLQCEDGETAYSYEMTRSQETTIIPCGGRDLPLGCYTIDVAFVSPKQALDERSWSLYLGILSAMGVLVFFLVRRKELPVPNVQQPSNRSLGIFTFYPDQNKLVQPAEEIPLSQKECELLAIFVERPNLVIKREELIKRVWEDHGVFVSRSLDTYISKLRKKLKADTSLKLTNIHGVGYKLEVRS